MNIITARMGTDKFGGAKIVIINQLNVNKLKKRRFLIRTRYKR